MFAAVSPWEYHPLGQRLIPVIDAQGQVMPEPEDGLDLLRGNARRFLRNVGVITEEASIEEVMKAVAAPPVLFANSDFDVVVTNSRAVIIGNKVDQHGKRLVGQIRFPWISCVGFRPKQSFLNDAELVIKAVEDFGSHGPVYRGDGQFEHTFTFVFEKSFHPGGIAQTIAQRAARYVASVPGVPLSQELIDLQIVGPLPDPPKGEHAEYYAKVFCSVPQGEYQLGDGHHQADWVVATI